MPSASTNSSGSHSHREANDSRHDDDGHHHQLQQRFCQRIDEDREAGDLTAPGMSHYYWDVDGEDGHRAPDDNYTTANRQLVSMLPSKSHNAAAAVASLRWRSKVRSAVTGTLGRQTQSRPDPDLVYGVDDFTDNRSRNALPTRTATGEDSDVEENDAECNEQMAWENIEHIKTLTIPMSLKKSEKARILNKRKKQLDKYEELRWRQQKYLSRLTKRLNDWWSNVELWNQDMKLVEGNYGSGVKAYFEFLRWLFYLNVIIFSLIFLFVTVPTIIFTELTDKGYDNSPCYGQCRTSAGSVVLDIFQGTGCIEKSIFFYGCYPNNTNHQIDGDYHVYNIPLAYLFITAAYFLVSLVMIVSSAVKGFKERLVIDEGGKFHLYSNLVFGGWDFCIHNEKAAMTKHKAIYNELKGCLESERLEEQRISKEKSTNKLFVVRICVNLIVIGILASCGYLIYWVFQKTTQTVLVLEQEDFIDLLKEFLPSITIVSMNMVVPFVFQYLITFELYTPLVTIRLTLVRTVFLRLASLLVLYASLYDRISDTTDSNNKIVCWENYVGQQLYKLVLTDFATQVITTFVVNYPRRCLADRHGGKFCRLVGDQTFDLPRHVLDVVYSQTLCWVGCYYAPLLSAVTLVTSFLMFYVKKFACLVNSKPSSTIYRVSRSKSMFMVVALISYVVAVLPVAYSIGMLSPSSECGPFNHLHEHTVWQEINYSVKHIEKLKDVLSFLGTAGFVVPLLMVLVLLLYYYSAVNNANQHMVIVLKNQLLLEGQDKHFLLARLTQFLKQHQAEGDTSFLVR